jgi:glycosyltransferase involved in cell wall biosynthesis
MTLPKKPKLLIVSYSFPPFLSASAVLINNIFSKYKGQMEAIGGSNFTRIDKSFSPPCKSYYIKHPRGRIFEAISRRFHYLFLPIYYYLIFIRTKKIKPDVIFANFPREVMLVATYKVATKLGIPFYVYMHDLWEENMRLPGPRQFATKWESKVLHAAKRVICCTHSAKEHYKAKYNIDSDVLLHPIPDEEIEVIKKQHKLSNAKVTILYSGSLSTLMNQDAFVMMSRALDLLPENYELLWLPISKDGMNNLGKLGIDSKKIRIEYVDRDQLKIEMQRADIMFAPLSHKNCSIEEVKTVFSNKLLGYLVSGKPILVFGPKDCHHVELAKAGHWGYAVDEDSSLMLSKAVLDMAANETMCNELVRHALIEANNRRASHAASLIETWVKLDSNY